MLILAFETSAKAVSVALHDGGVLLAESYQNTGLTHSQTLMSMAQDLLKNCRKSVQDVTAVAVAAGPGSFTGVRIGVAAAKGFGWGAQIPVYGVSTLESMARSLGICDGLVCACMDARRSQVYNALFRVTGGRSPVSAQTVPSVLTNWRRNCWRRTSRFFWLAMGQDCVIIHCWSKCRTCA